MSESAAQTQKIMIADIIKKRLIEKIEALFETNTEKQGKHAEKNRATLTSIINKDNNPQLNHDELKIKMIHAINQLDLSKYNLNEHSGYKDGVGDCMQALQNLGIATEKWKFGTQEIEKVLLDAEKKIPADIERQLKKEEQKLIDGLINQLKPDKIEDIMEGKSNYEIEHKIGYRNIPKEYRESDNFIIALVELELKLKQKGLKNDVIDKNDPAFFHPYHLIDDYLPSRSEKARKLISELLEIMPLVPMRDLVKPRGDWKETVKEHQLVINEPVYIYTAQRDPNALEFIPKGSELLRNEKLLEAALKLNALQLKFVSDDMKQKIIDKIGAENLLKNNILAYKYFPDNEANSNIIKSFFSKIEYIVVNPVLGDPELRDSTLVFGNKEKRKGKTAFVGFNLKRGGVGKSDSEEITAELDELITSIKAANNKNNLNIAFTAHSNVTGNAPGIGHASYDDIANLCKKHWEIKHIDLLTCKAAGTQLVTQAEKNMISELKKKEYELKKYLFARIPPNESKESLSKYGRAICEKNNAAGVYFLIEDKKSIPKYSLQIIKLVNNKLITKNVPIPSNKEKFIEQFEIKYHQKRNESVNNNSEEFTPLSLDELIQLRATTKEQHRFDPNHPKFQEDKKIFPFLADLIIEEQDLKESPMKTLVDTLRRQNITQKISIQAYNDYMEVDTKTNYLRAVKTFTLTHAGYKESLYGTGLSNADPIKVIDDRVAQINQLLSDKELSSAAKTLKVTLNSNSVEIDADLMQDKSQGIEEDQSTAKRSDVESLIMPSNDAHDEQMQSISESVGSSIDEAEEQVSVQEDIMADEPKENSALLDEEINDIEDLEHNDTMQKITPPELPAIKLQTLQRKFKQEITEIRDNNKDSSEIPSATPSDRGSV